MSLWHLVDVQGLAHVLLAIGHGHAPCEELRTAETFIISLWQIWCVVIAAVVVHAGRSVQTQA
jgi:hypothetical protein